MCSRGRMTVETKPSQRRPPRRSRRTNPVTGQLPARSSPGSNQLRSGIAGRPPGPGFPECESETFDFVGEGTLRELGLDVATPVAPPDPDRVGMIWVTHELKPHDVGGPGGAVERYRMLCFEYPDGSGGSGWPVDPSWRPPSALGTATGDAPDGGISPAVLLAGLVIALLIGVSVVAFRRGS